MRKSRTPIKLEVGQLYKGGSKIVEIISEKDKSYLAIERYSKYTPYVIIFKGLENNWSFLTEKDKLELL